MYSTHTAIHPLIFVFVNCSLFICIHLDLILCFSMSVCWSHVFLNMSYIVCLYFVLKYIIY